MQLAAPAKINLMLSVLGKRSDGYHLLESLVAFTAAGDRLDVAHGGASQLDVTGPFGGDLAGQAADTNLVVRALRALERATNETLDASLTLHKNLPVASGMGGGSADAAATLRGLVQLFALPVEDDELLQLAAQLGADVPVCLQAQATWMRGIGHDVTRLPALPQADIVLVNPLVELSTAQVFAQLHASLVDETAQSVPPIVPKIARDGFKDLPTLCRFLVTRGNDLQKVATQISPVIGDCLAALVGDKTLYAAMSGSGASCFALCAPGDGAAVAAAFQAKRPNDWVVATQFINRFQDS